MPISLSVLGKDNGMQVGLRKKLRHTDQKIKIGLVQISSRFGSQIYLPVTVGFLHAYATKNVSDINDFEFMPPIYRRVDIDDIVEQLSDADIVAFSVYVWNYMISTRIAKKISQKYPNKLIIYGGPHVPMAPYGDTENFLRKNEHIDIAFTGEGEIAFAAFLNHYKTKTWHQIPSIHFIDSNNYYYSTPSAPRIEDLNEIPSPFLNGFFEPILNLHPEEQWIGSWETNRGCPFKCTYCDWGVGAKKRMASYEIDRLYKEIDWFSEQKVGFIYCIDSNFGMYKDRDLALVQKFVANKKKYGYPEVLSVQNTKNSTEASYNIQKLMNDSGLSKGVLLAFQSLHEPTLKAIKRSNIKLETFFELQRRFTSDGVETFSDMILGLPEETYESFTDGVCTLVEMGQHNRIQFDNLTVLPNSEMAESQYLNKYGMKLVSSKIVNIHGSLDEETYETQQLVVATNTMPIADWQKARTFAYMIALLHFDKLLQIPFVVMNKLYSVGYKDIINTFLGARSPILSNICSFFQNKSLDIQNGGSEYCASTQWLNAWWPPDEYVYIDLIKSKKVDDFYAECEVLLTGILDRFIEKYHISIIKDALLLNKEMLKLPYQQGTENVNCSSNVWEMYSMGIIGEGIDFESGDYIYSINRSESPESWDEWYQKVVWYGHKRGAYLYKCERM